MIARRVNRMSPFNVTSLALGLAFLYLPIVILVIYSFNASRLVTVWGGWSLRWYYEFFNDRAMLDAAPHGIASQKPAGLVPRGAKRGVLETTFRELHLAAPAPVNVIPLAPGAPFGTVNLDVEGCTLCHACVTACPSGALSDNPDRAMLRFTESLCVQCGLCEATCPEKVITIEPRLDFEAWNSPQRVLKEEEPFNCIACGKPFGTKSSIDRVLAKLGEKHWMFQGANARRLDVIKMCADCRVEAVVNESFDPHAAPQRPPVMSTEDYLRARNVKKDDPLGS